MIERMPKYPREGAIDTKNRDQFNKKTIWKKLFGDGYEKFSGIKYDRYEIIPGEVKNTLLQVLSAEYYKLPIKNESGEFVISAAKKGKRKEGIAFAEDVVDRLRMATLDDKGGEIKKYPTILATVLKDPKIKGIIDPDATDAIKNISQELKNMIKAYQVALVEIVGRMMKQGEPFLHMLVSERRTTKDNDIVIAGGMRKQGFPADPRVLRWFQEKLAEKLEEYEIQKVADKPVKVRIAEEGETICGSPVHVSRREILGDLYQFIKAKIPTNVLQSKRNEVVDILARIAQDFQNEFPDEESLQNYLEEHTTEEDKVRLEGKILKEAMIVSDDDRIESQSGITALESGHIAFTKNLASVIGVLEGDRVTVVKEDDPNERQFTVTIVKKINGKIPRQPVFSNQSGIQDGQKVIVSTLVEIKKREDKQRVNDLIEEIKKGSFDDGVVFGLAYKGVASQDPELAQISAESLLKSDRELQHNTVTDLLTLMVRGSEDERFRYASFQAIVVLILKGVGNGFITNEIVISGIKEALKTFVTDDRVGEMAEKLVKIIKTD